MMLLLLLLGTMIAVLFSLMARGDDDGGGDDDDEDEGDRGESDRGGESNVGGGGEQTSDVGGGENRTTDFSAPAAEAAVTEAPPGAQPELGPQTLGEALGTFGAPPAPTPEPPAGGGEPGWAGPSGGFGITINPTERTLAGAPPTSSEWRDLREIARARGHALSPTEARQALNEIRGQRGFDRGEQGRAGGFGGGGNQTDESSDRTMPERPTEQPSQAPFAAPFTGGGPIGAAGPAERPILTPLPRTTPVAPRPFHQEGPSLRDFLQQQSSFFASNGLAPPPPSPLMGTAQIAPPAPSMQPLAMPAPTDTMFREPGVEPVGFANYSPTPANQFLGRQLDVRTMLQVLDDPTQSRLLASFLRMAGVDPASAMADFRSRLPGGGAPVPPTQFR